MLIWKIDSIVSLGIYLYMNPLSDSSSDFITFYCNITYIAYLT